MRANEFIIEAVGGNYLYHGVPKGDTVTAIIKSGFIKPQEVFDFDRNPNDDSDEANPPVISLSRDQRLRFPYGEAVAQFVIDKDALIRAGIIAKPKVGTGYGRIESEERVYKPIPVKAPYVVAIQYDPALKIPKSILDYAKQSGIKMGPWQPVKQTASEPEYDINYPNRVDSSEEDLDVKITNILKTGTEPLPDWKSIMIDDGPGWSTIYYDIPGWSNGIAIQPFKFISPDLAKQILPQLQQLTKAGQSIRSVMNKYALIQHGKNWKQGIHRIYPGDSGYKVEVPPGN